MFFIDCFVHIFFGDLFFIFFFFFSYWLIKLNTIITNQYWLLIVICATFKNANLYYIVSLIYLITLTLWVNLIHLFQNINISIYYHLHSLAMMMICLKGSNIVIEETRILSWAVVILIGFNLLESLKYTQLSSSHIYFQLYGAQIENKTCWSFHRRNPKCFQNFDLFLKNSYGEWRKYIDDWLEYESVFNVISNQYYSGYVSVLRSWGFSNEKKKRKKTDYVKMMTLIVIFFI